MDFYALPRRDLQALCKRNGVRANMTNAAMADALGALPTVDGIEEYVKQPAAVPAPVDKAAVEESAAGEAGEPAAAWPSRHGQDVRGRRGGRNQGQGRGEGGGRAATWRGASRSWQARSACTAAAASVDETVVVEEKKQEKPLPRARRGTLKSSEPTKQNGSEKKRK
ncbi:hypothetical protein EJB05_39451 [Eragrostis curvula]|uniref:Uncharacterized protein n=1 Tax=Eragrostis curvula TaxID=38414 RepID=A0A5J9TYH2_9POAL|nr:hypothetical protein EJB05_39451 [Eragrostis curvula]